MGFANTPGPGVSDLPDDWAQAAVEAAPLTGEGLACSSLCLLLGNTVSL